MYFVRLIVGLLAVLLIQVVSLAQTDSPRRPGNEPSTSSGSVRGRVVLPGGENLSEPIKVSLRSVRGSDGFIYTDAQGRFEMTGIASGEYAIEVEPERDSKFEIATEKVLVQRNAPTVVTIFLKEKALDSTARPDGRVISATELGQDVPAAAEKEFNRGTKLGQAGKNVEAIVCLKKAIAIFPNYLMARNDLATYLLAEGRLDEAAEELRAAIKIDSNAFKPRLNYGIVLVEQQRFPEAVEWLEKAIALDTSSPAAHLYAGIAFFGLEEFERAEKELSVSYQLGGKQYARALFYLGRLYMDRGAHELARKNLEAYLRESPGAHNADEVRRMIAMLR